MNYNVLAYSLFVSIVGFMTIWVGFVFYKNGKFYLYNLLNKNVEMANYINKILLIGYYLINLGYALFTIIFWRAIHSYTEMLERVCTNAGIMILGLGIMHFINLFWIYLFHKNIKTNKSINYGN